MNIAGLLFLIITQFLIGRGILYLLNIKERLLSIVALSSILGVATISFLPMLLEMCHISLTMTNVSISIIVTTLLTNIFIIRRYSINSLKGIRFKIPDLTELFFIAMFIALMIPSIWRCFYYPPFARDVFSVNLLDSLPNLIKPPFITDLQIIYKLLVHPFGQVWLTIIVISFLVWFYNRLREKLHVYTAGVCMMLFLCIPELYGYTYTLLWDYSNMIFFTTGFYYLYKYIEGKEYNYFLFACLLLGFATFIRLDSLIFIGLCVPLLLFFQIKDRVPMAKIAYSAIVMVAIPYAVYFICMKVFVKHYLPVHPDIEDGFNFQSVSQYMNWFSEMNNKLIFAGDNIDLYGYYIYIFLLIVALDAIVFKHFNREAIWMLAGVLIIYFTMPSLGYFTKWYNHTTAKRGLFKMFALMALYFTSSATMKWLSTSLIGFENQFDTKEKTKPALTHVKQKGKKK
jgi:hypothetical protein